MTCPACRHANRETARFCEACGVRFEARCSACGNVARAGARFCDTCGQTLGPIPGHPASHTAGETAAIAAHHRLVFLELVVMLAEN